MDHARRTGVDKVLMLDDDLRFFRTVDGKGRRLNSDGVREMVAVIDAVLDDFDAVTVASRRYVRHMAQPCEINKRIVQVYGLHRCVWRRDFKFRLRVAEDVDFSMQLISTGHVTCALTCYCYEDVAHRGSGGCSTWRTDDLERREAETLKELWPEEFFIRTKPFLKVGLGSLGVKISWKAVERAGEDARDREAQIQTQ